MLVFSSMVVYTSQVLFTGFSCKHPDLPSNSMNLQKAQGITIMNYIVLDLEWNQCPTGKNDEIPHLPFEIIEIGAVKLDETHHILDQFQEVIKPVVYTTLHYKTKEIIRLKAIDFKSARSFPEVIADFWEWCGDSPIFCTWGPADLTELQRNLAYHHLASPFAFPLIYYDIQKIFSIVYEDRKSRRSLESAVDYLQLPKNIPFHSALSDACYTAQILQTINEASILANSSIDYYRTPQNRRQEIYLSYDTYTKFVSKPFDTKTHALKDRVVSSTSCYLCSRTLQKKIRWFPVGSRNYCCLAYCKEHGYLKGKIRMRQREDGRYYAIKTLKLVSEETAYELYEKKEILKLKRKLKKEFSQNQSFLQK